MSWEVVCSLFCAPPSDELHRALVLLTEFRPSYSTFSMVATKMAAIKIEDFYGERRRGGWSLSVSVLSRQAPVEVSLSSVVDTSALRRDKGGEEREGSRDGQHSGNTTLG